MPSWHAAKAATDEKVVDMLLMILSYREPAKKKTGDGVAPPKSG